MEEITQYPNEEKDIPIQRFWIHRTVKRKQRLSDISFRQGTDRKWHYSNATFFSFLSISFVAWNGPVGAFSGIPKSCFNTNGVPRQMSRYRDNRHVQDPNADISSGSFSQYTTSYLFRIKLWDTLKSTKNDSLSQNQSSEERNTRNKENEDHSNVIDASGGFVTEEIKSRETASTNDNSNLIKTTNLLGETVLDSKNRPHSSANDLKSYEQLQKRFEAAMKRRKTRHEQKAKMNGISIGNTNDVIGLQASFSDLGEENQPSLIENEQSEMDNGDYEGIKQANKILFEEEKSDLSSNNGSPQWERGAPSRTSQSKIKREKKSDRYSDQYLWDDPFVESIDEYEFSDGGKEFDHRRLIPTKPTCEWETYRSTSVLFPPQPANVKNTILSHPKAIIHFVGGTFFGSYPRKFYGKLLEDIACKCDAVVVATSIPLMLPGRGLVSRLEKLLSEEDWNALGEQGMVDGESENPLDHEYLAKEMQREFNSAYRDVILDEYCSDRVREDEVESFMKNVPIVGLGHSLGARIQAVSCSHPRVSKRYLSMGKGKQLIRSGREGMIYLGFANWGASSSIPGIDALGRTVKNRSRVYHEGVDFAERTRTRLPRKFQERTGWYGQREEERLNNEWEGTKTRAGLDYDMEDEDMRFKEGASDRYGDDHQNRHKQYDGTRRRRGKYERYYGHDEDDLDLVDVVSGVVSSVTNGARQIGAALTPDARDLEFNPTPNELWDAISSSDGCYSKSCQNNLIVQFVDDPIDQGSRLARTFLSVCRSETDSSKPNEGNGKLEEPLHDVKFARLQGGHLTPVTLQEGVTKLLPRGVVSLLSSSSDFVLRQLGEERINKSYQRQQREQKDVADTVASYIREVIHKRPS